MKTLKIYWILLISIAFSACENPLDTPVKFEVEVSLSDNITIDGDGIIKAPVGTSITFNFLGEPDFISFSYDLFNETTSTLSFSSLLSWNNDKDNTLQLFVSKSFPGLTKIDAKADSVTIHNHEWINISDRCSFPTERNASETSSISFDEFKGDSVVLAFKYNTINNNGFQPMWTINDLKIDNIVVKTGENALSVPAATMGFTPFDMLNMIPDESAYISNTNGGTWDISTPASLKIRQTASGRSLNEDWLISRPIHIIRGKIEQGSSIAVKNTTDWVSSFTHKFEENGEYTVTFKAANYNYKSNSKTERSFKILIENQP